MKKLILDWLMKVTAGFVTALLLASWYYGGKLERLEGKFEVLLDNQRIIATAIVRPDQPGPLAIKDFPKD